MAEHDVGFVGLSPGFVGTWRSRGTSVCGRRGRLRRSRRILMAVAETAESSGASESMEPEKGYGEFQSMFEHVRGTDVPTVSETIAAFNKEFARPVPVVYRSIVNEMITTTHLSRVCAMWRYDEIFAFGYDEIFDDYLRFYPNEEEKERIYNIMAKALKFDPAQLRADGTSVRAWLEGKKEQDVFQLVEEGGDSSAAPYPALNFLQNAGRFDWYYSRLFGIGLIKIMDKVGVELTIANAEKWADKLRAPKSKLSAEMAEYLASVERLKQAEQIFAEASAREARKVADRLAAKAAKAKAEAEEAETEASEEEKPVVEEASAVSSTKADNAP